jgi:hypothetical protein
MTKRHIILVADSLSEGTANERGINKYNGFLSQNTVSCSSQP